MLERMPRIRQGTLLRRALPIVATLAWVVAPGATQAASRDQLRVIVEDQCVPHWSRAHAAAPCESVTLPPAGTAGQGYALLHDITGGAHYLLIPTETIAGIESAELLLPSATNFFQAAWEARASLARDAGRPVPDDAVALAINSSLARTQDQLHVHISCQRKSVHDALSHKAEGIGPEWAPILLSTGPYHAMRVMGASLVDANPFALLAGHLPGARAQMGRYSLMVAAMTFNEGPGFIVLAGDGVPGSAMLLDPECTMAGETPLLLPREIHSLQVR